MTVVSLVLPFVVGAFFWTFSEYVLHRWFHTARGSNLASKEHLAHHARSVYRISSISWLAWAGVLVVGMGVLPLLAWTVLPLGGAIAFGVGWVVAYFTYEWIHAAIHLWAPRTAYGRWTRSSHLHHHFVAPLHNFGVTTPLWDVVFRTYDSPAQLRVPRRLAMVWLLDEAGEVRPEHRASYVVRGTRTEIGPEEISVALANQPPSA
jgi:sterol desaturase/sphingolipid hydroxylase (fatty acid hydroxylase superfamily)